jgi:hypothetical protein
MGGIDLLWNLNVELRRECVYLGVKADRSCGDI